MAPTATRASSRRRGDATNDGIPKSSPKKNNASASSPLPQRISTRTSTAAAAASANTKQAATNNEQGAPSSPSKQTTSNDQAAIDLMKPFLSSLQSYVTAQVGARIDSIMANEYHRKTLGISRDALQSEAERMFPFLRNVNWFLERKERMEQCQRVIEARTAAGPDAIRGEREALLGVFERSERVLDYGQRNTEDGIEEIAANVFTTAVAAKKSADLGRKMRQTRSRRIQAANSSVGEEEEEEEEEVAGLKQPPETLAARETTTASITKKRKASTSPKNSPPTKKMASPVEPQSDSEESYQPGVDDDSDSDTLRPAKKYTKKNSGDKATPGTPRQKIPFTERLQQCREYKQKHGHLRIPRNEKENNLGTFAQSMRTNYQKFFSGVKKGGRSNRKKVGIQLEMLEEIAFPFDYARMNGAHDAVTTGPTSAEATTGEGSLAQAESQPRANNGRGAVWEYYLGLARQFKEEHGHLNIPKHNEIGAWADRMRGLYNQRLQGKKSTQLTTVEKEKIQLLEGMGFAFDKAFDVNLQKFIAYKESTGKSKVPCKYDPDRALGSWAEMIRREHSKMNKGESSEYLTSDRMRKLAGAGFTFRSRPREIPWEERLEMLRVYKAENNGNDPPLSHPTMGNWTSKIRVYYYRKMDGKKTHLSDERIEQLRNLGFVFQKGKRPSAEDVAKTREGRKISWDDRLQEFIRWKEKHGHPFVPTVCHNEDKYLGRWVVKQRMAYKYYQAGKVQNRTYGILTAEKALKLANAGFAFEASHIRRTPKDDVDDSKNIEAAGHDDDEEMEQNIGDYNNIEAAGHDGDDEVEVMERTYEEVAPEEWNAYEPGAML